MARLRRSLITGAGISAGAALGVASTASAADFAVDTIADTAPTAGECTSPTLTDCSLRQAIDAANTNGGATEDYITFNSGVTGTMTLTGGEMLITQPVYINGPGANTLTITAHGASRIFNIDMSGANTLPVAIYRLTLTGGHTIFNGGAVYDGDAVLKVNESVLTGNSAGTSGGAIAIGGHDSQHGADNIIYADTITGNTAGNEGGGVYSPYSIGTLATSTVTGNHMTSTASDHVGAGVYSYEYGFVIDSTIAGNGPAGAGGGLASGNGMLIYSSILADNYAVANPDLVDIGTGPLNAAFSLIENGESVTTTVGPNIIGQDPQLGPLQNNGGATPTMEPGGGSPVIDQGRSRFGRDQRLEPRRIDNPTIANAPGGDAADIGALELPYVAPAVAPPPTKKKKCKKHKKKHAASAKKKCKKKKKK